MERSLSSQVFGLPQTDENPRVERGVILRRVTLGFTWKNSPRARRLSCCEKNMLPAFPIIRWTLLSLPAD